jgi:hypothetical protein
MTGIWLRKWLVGWESKKSILELQIPLNTGPGIAIASRWRRLSPVCEEPTKFEVGKDRYPWPPHWRGVAFVLKGYNYSLNRITEEYMLHLKKAGAPNVRGLPIVYSVCGEVMEVYPTPSEELEMVQSAEQPEITRGMLVVEW